MQALGAPVTDAFDLTVDDGHGGTTTVTITVALLPPDWHLV